MNRKLVMTVVGARPQFVKLAPFCRRLSGMEAPPFRHAIVHTGQHYDDSMSGGFFRELGIPAPDRDLGVGSGSHAWQTGSIMAGLERAFADFNPDLILVYGDTNSTLAAALVAAKGPVPLAHVEAGLRSFRRGMPEEVNRVVTDRLSDLLFCPTPAAAAQLAQEGITAGVHVVGDIMLDVFLAGRANTDPAEVLERLAVPDGPFALCTLHRAENTDDAARLGLLMAGLARLSARMPVILPLHPRTRAALHRHGLEPDANVRLFAPLGHGDTLALLSRASVVLTDSGGLQKEAYFAAAPCVTLREETEWVETLEGGWNRLMGPDLDSLTAAVEGALAHPRRPPPAPVFGDGNAAGAIIGHLARYLGAA